MNMRSWRLGLLLVFVIGLGHSLAQDSAKPTSGDKPKAKISGRVLTTDGKPLAKATVSLWGQRQVMAKTDADGAYSVEVEPGTYSVAAQRKGYGQASYQVENSDSSQTPLTVEAGQHLSNINLRLPKGGVITGRIVDEDGEPVVEERVDVVPRAKQRYFSRYGLRTDDRGVYRIYGLPSGPYYVIVYVSEESDSRRAEVTTYYPGVPLLEEATEVMVTEGKETTGIDFKVKKSSNKGKIFGRIARADTGQPLAGASVSVQRQDRFTRHYLNIRSDSEGGYETDGLAPGKYLVHISVQDRSEIDPEQVLVPGMGQEVFVDAAPVEVNFELERAGEVSGRVVLENGLPLKEAAKLYLWLRPIERGEMRVWGGQAQPKSDGRFTINRVSPGVHHLEVGNLPSAHYLKSVMLDKEDVRESGIPIEPGSEIEGVMVVLSDAVATLKGRVLGERGPLPGVTVVLLSANALTTENLRAIDHRNDKTDQRGRFEIKGIRPGRYFIVALRGDLSQLEGRRDEDVLVEFLRRRQDRLQIIELKPKETKEVDVKPIVVGADGQK